VGFEPQKFFIGMIDFFSILLPGVIVTYVLSGDAGDSLLGEAYPDLEGGEAVAFFLVVSYLLGHFVFLVGAAVLDDLVYDPLREATVGRQALLKAGKKPARAWVRRLSRLFVGKAENADNALLQAIAIKEGRLTDAEAAINAFQWCKARLLFEKPEALAKVERFEADSKFFRSLVVLFAVLAPAFFISHEWRLSALALVLLAMALWRYVDQRVKATTHAYWYLITLEADDRRAAG
jgi:hypothetical protein